MLPVVVTDSSYEFVPPHEGRVWPKLLTRLSGWILRRRYRVVRVEFRGQDKVRSLLRDGQSILLTPNHCRMSDALVLQEFARDIRQPFFYMASSHLFRGNRAFAWMLQRIGAFSVNREGVDRQAVQTAIEILAQGKRPLVVFPEGALSRSNERINALMEGVSLMARQAANRIAKQEARTEQPGKKVFVVPIAIRYLFQGDIVDTASQMLTEIEQRLTWRPMNGKSLVDRIYSVGPALLALKELQYLGETRTGPPEERIEHLIHGIIQPLEQEWLGEPSNGSVIRRVKELRKAIVPDMIEGQMQDDELERRWIQLQDMDLAQSLSLFPPKYVASKPSVDRILETVERITENLSGEEQIHGPMHAIVQVGEPLEVSAKRDRGLDTDPVLTHIEQSLTTMLESLSASCRMYAGSESDR